jgi:archaellum biogenesis protein FlaJ (TadC family)
VYLVTAICSLAINKLDKDRIIEVLSNSKTFDKFLKEMQSAYENMDFYYRAEDDQNELYFWDRWTQDLPKELIEQIANEIIGDK